MKVVWSRLSLRLLDEIYEYIAKDSPGHAALFVAELACAPDRLEEQPRSGRIVAEFGDPELYEIVHRGYRILYRIEHDVTIVAVADGRQDLQRMSDENRF